TVIGITTFSALKRGPALSDPSDCSVYEPMSPSSAFETYTKVAATHWALKSSDESAMTNPALKFFTWVLPGVRNKTLATSPVPPCSTTHAGGPSPRSRSSLHVSIRPQVMYRQSIPLWLCCLRQGRRSGPVASERHRCLRHSPPQ